MRRTLQLALLLLLISSLHPLKGQVAIGTGATAPTPNPNAVLLLVGNGTNQGLIIPSVTSLSGFGSAGMVVYNSSSNTVHYHNGTAWNQVGAGGGGTQGIQISGNTVSLTATPNAGFGLSSPTPTATGQLLVWNGTGWESTPAPTTSGQTLSWNQTTGKWTIGTGATVATLSGDVSGASNSTTIANSAGNNIATALNNAATTNRILESRITPSGTNNQVLTTVAGVTQWANATGGTLPSLSANQLLSNNGSNTGINVSGDLGLSVSGTTGTFTITNNAVTTSKILDANVTNAKLNKTGIPLSGFAAPTVAVDFGSQRLINLATPTAATDATTKAYVDITDATKLNSTILTTSGDILYNDGTSTTRLPRGASGTVLQSTTSGIQWAPGGGSGEANTASNTGIGGVGVFDQKTGVNLDFRSINAATNRIGVALDAANNEIDIDVNEANLSIASSQLTGQLGVANGGTGSSTLPLNSVLLGNGTGAISAVTGGSPTNVLTLNVSNIPVWLPVPGGVSAVSGSGPITVANGTSTPAISITQANASTPGFLSASDFSAFNAKQNALTFGDVTSANAALTVTGGTGAAVGGNVSLNLNTGTGANQLVQLNSSGQLPAVDGSQLTGLPGGGDINGVDTPVGGGLTGGLLSGTPSLRLINGSATGQVLKWDNPTTSWVIGTDDVGGGALPTLSDAQVIISVGANNPQGRVLQQDVSIASASGNVTVQGLRGTPISATAPAANQVLKFSAGTYSPAADNDSQNLSIGGTGTVATGETFPLAITGGTGINIIEGTNVQIDRAGSNLTINTSGGGAPTGPATGDLAGSYPAPTINTASATTGANIITAVNTASAGTINTARLNAGVVLDTESPVAGDITGNYGAGFQIASGVITGTDLVNNITIATTGNLTGANVIGNGSGLTSLNAGNFSSGTLAVARGGTGITAVTPGGIAYGGASNFAFTPAGTAGQLLQSNGAGAPTWVPAPASFTTVNTVPKGSAGGLIASTIFDSGTYTGIGRTTPIGSSRFDIQATGFGASYGGMYIQTDNTGWPFYGYSNNGGTSMWTYWNGATGTWNVYNNGDRLSVTNSGNVGIGTTSPALPLHAVGADAGVGAANSGTAATGSLRLTTGGVPALDIGIADDTYLGGWLQVHQPSNQAINFPLLLNPNGGNVGIGSTTPNAQLQLSNSVGRKIVLFEQANNDNQVMGFSLGGLGTFESQIPINSNAFVWKAGASATSSTELMRLTGTGSLILANTDWPLNAVQLQSTAANAGASIRFTNPAVGNRTYDLIGSTGNGASPGPGAFGIYDNTSLAYRFVINSAGNVGIGTFSPTQKLHVIGNILASGTITPSDSRLKENISELNYGLKEILRLRPVSYNWKTDPNGKKVLGLIAQETVKVTPEVIELPQSEKDFYSMNYVQLIPVLIKAAQELNQKNESLEKENSLLKAEVAAFKQKQDREMASLKKQLEAINSRLGLEAKKD